MIHLVDLLKVPAALAIRELIYAADWQLFRRRLRQQERGQKAHGDTGGIDRTPGGRQRPRTLPGQQGTPRQ